MDYPKLHEVNKQLPPQTIQGKQYVGVAARVDGFRYLYPEGRIVTEIVSITEKTVIMKATAYDADKLLSTGHGMEFRDDTTSFVNKWAFLENCETSAVGRCLGFLAINGAGGEIATSEEVNQKLEYNFQENKEKPFVPDYVKKAETKPAEQKQEVKEDVPSDPQYQRLLADATAIGVDMAALTKYSLDVYQTKIIPAEVLKQSITNKKISIAQKSSVVETAKTMLEAKEC